MTDWGPLAEKFLVSDEANEYDIYGFSEHHLNKTNIKRFATVCKSSNRRPFFASARQKNSGTSGGVLLAPRVHLCIEPFSSPPRIFHVGEDWVAFILRLRGLDVIIIQLYLVSGIGPAKENLHRLNEILSFALGLRLYFIIFGNFNMTPEQLSSIGLLVKATAAVATVDNRAPTCRTG